MSDTPVFVDLQGFTVNGQFIVKEFAVLKGSGRELIHYIFLPPVAWHLLTSGDRSQAIWLTDNHHGLRWNDGYVDYSVAKTLMRSALPDEPETRVYVKGMEKKQWLVDIAGGKTTHLFFANIDTDYDNVGPLRRMNADGTIRCGRHEKSCAMENVLKLAKWWRERLERIRNVLSMDDYRSTTTTRDNDANNKHEDTDDDGEEEEEDTEL